jgi:hypothetical protein
MSRTPLFPAWAVWLLVGAPLVGFCALATGFSMRHPTWFDVGAGGVVGLVLWIVLAAQLQKWWKEGRRRLWLAPLAWLAFFIPYLWPALLFRRPRSWWKRAASAHT